MPLEQRGLLEGIKVLHCVASYLIFKYKQRGDSYLYLVRVRTAGPFSLWPHQNNDADRLSVEGRRFAGPYTIII